MYARQFDTLKCNLDDFSEEALDMILIKWLICERK